MSSSRPNSVDSLFEVTSGLDSLGLLGKNVLFYATLFMCYWRSHWTVLFLAELSGESATSKKVESTLVLAGPSRRSIDEVLLWSVGYLSPFITIPSLARLLLLGCCPAIWTFRFSSLLTSASTICWSLNKLFYLPNLSLYALEITLTRLGEGEGELTLLFCADSAWLPALPCIYVYVSGSESLWELLAKSAAFLLNSSWYENPSKFSWLPGSWPVMFWLADYSIPIAVCSASHS